MALTQGAPLPNITETTTTTPQAPEYYTQYLTGLSQAGQQAMARPAGQMVAGYDPLQTQGYAAVPTAAQAYQPGLTAAQKTATTAAAGAVPQISAFMNPYTRSVVDEMARLSQQNLQRNIMPTLKAGFVGSGGLGGQRYAGALGQTMADIQASLTGQQAGALQKGYGEALQAALQNVGQQRQAAETQGQLAQEAQNLGLTGAGALTKAGAERQAYQQSLLDAPLRTASEAAKLMSGYQIPLTTGVTRVGPGQQSQYQASPLQSAIGILSLIGAAQPGMGQASGQTGTPSQTQLGGQGLNLIYDKAAGLWRDIFGNSQPTGGQTTTGGQNPMSDWGYDFSGTQDSMTDWTY